MKRIFNPKDITFNIRINSQTFRTFYEACKRHNVPYSRMVRLLIEQWLYKLEDNDDENK